MTLQIVIYRDDDDETVRETATGWDGTGRRAEEGDAERTNNRESYINTN